MDPVLYEGRPGLNIPVNARIEYVYALYNKARTAFEVGSCRPEFLAELKMMVDSSGAWFTRNNNYLKYFQ
jgi:hypothetical protein